MNNGIPRQLIVATRLAWLLVAFSFHSLAVGAADKGTQTGPSYVGELGDAKRLAFEGLKTFSAQAVREGLMKDPDFLLAAHPAAPFGGYLEALQKRIRTGYQEAGFPDVQVTVVPELKTGHILVRVNEGPRYRIEEVKIRGAKTIPADRLAQVLMRGYPPREATAPSLDFQAANRAENSASFSFSGSLGSQSMVVDRTTGQKVVPVPAAWERGKPLSFADPASHVRAVTNALAVLGNLGAKVAVTPERHPEGGTVGLLVDLLDEGKLARIEEIRVEGNQKNTREDILDYLGLKPGMPWRYDLIPRIGLGLSQSARFLAFNVTANFVDNDPARLRLQLALTECKPAPSLREEFSPAENVLLKLCDWLARIQNRSEDIMVSTLAEAPGVPVGHGILSSNGLMLAAGLRHKEQSLQWHYAGTISRDLVGMVSQRRAKWFCPKPRFELSVWLELGPDNDPEDSDRLNFKLGAQFNSKPSQRESAQDLASPFHLDLRLAPVAFIIPAHRTGCTNYFKDGLFHLIFEDHRITVDPSSGRLLSVGPAGTNQELMVVKFGDGLLTNAIQELEKETAALLNGFDPQRPFGSTLSFVLPELADAPWISEFLFGQVDAAKRRRGSQALSRLLARPVFVPLDEFFIELFDESSETFYVPQPYAESPQAQSTTLVSMLAAWSFKYAHESFPVGSWPWTVAHEALFVANGQGKYTEVELRRLYDSDQTGPIGYLTIAQLLTYIKSPEARLFATRGLTRLAAGDFRKDWQLLIEGDSRLGRSLQQLAVALGALEEDDVEALTGILPSEAATLVRDSARALRANKTRPVAEILDPFLSEYWDNALKQKVRARLRAIIAGALRAGN